MRLKYEAVIVSVVLARAVVLLLVVLDFEY